MSPGPKALDITDASLDSPETALAAALGVALGNGLAVGRSGRRSLTMGSILILGAMTMPDLSAEQPAGDLDLLRILCCVAWSDGEMSEQERRLLKKLAERTAAADAGPEAASTAVDALAAEALGPEALETLLPRITTADDRQLAVKLAYQVLRISRRPEDTSSINTDEKLAYRRLVEGLKIDDREILEAEWAAEQELAQPPGLFAFLANRFRGLGAWADNDQLEPPGATSP